MIARRLERREVSRVRRERQESDPGTWLLVLIVPLMMLGGWLSQFV